MKLLPATLARYGIETPDAPVFAGRLVLPFPPPVNHLFTNAQRGGRVLSERGKSYKAEASMVAHLAGARPTACPVAVSVWLYRPRQVGDIDNPIKALLDSLTGICWQDDRQVVELHVYQRDDPKEPRAEVEIQEVKP